jgi:hypothetical protein
MNKKEKLIENVLDWTGGLPIEGDTKEELKASLKGRHWQIECELDQQANIFYREIDELDIPDE